jgi:ketosteroid isomerase-like protein
MTAASPTAGAIVQSYQTALGTGDFATARSFMQDSMTFIGPLESFSSADDYLASLKRLATIIQRIDLKHVFVDGDDVCVLYDMVTNTPAGTAFIAEWYQVRDGTIASLRALFDPRPFAPLFGGQSAH